MRAPTYRLGYVACENCRDWPMPGRDSNGSKCPACLGFAHVTREVAGSVELPSAGEQGALFGPGHVDVLR